MIKKVTIQDIGRDLHLSRNTVAKALGNSETVAYDTRLTVIRRAWEMGYQKISAEVLQEYGLSGNESSEKTVVVLVRRELSVFWNAIVVGISDELSKNNCRMRLNFVSQEDEMNGILPLDLKDGADAVIFMSVFDPAFTERVLKKELPTVFLDFPIGSYALPYNCDVVLCEGKKSICTLTRSLIDAGMTRLAFIGNTTYCESLKQRYEGFCEAMNAEHIEIDRDYVFTENLPEHYSFNDVENIIDAYKSMPEAIVCANDDIAIKAIKALTKKGISVPGDVAVTGFDNEEVLTHAEPMLTTVAVRNHKLGQRLVRQLIWRIENPDFPRETVTISTEIIYRSSSERHSSVD